MTSNLEKSTHSVDLERVDTATFRSALKGSIDQFAFLVIRNAIAPERIRTQFELMERSIKTLNEMVENSGPDILVIGEPEQNEKKQAKRIRKQKKILGVGQIEERTCNALLNFSLFDVLKDQPVAEHLAFLLKDFEISRYAHSRRVAALNRQVGSTHSGIDMHFDALYHDALRFGINLWVPLTPAGKEGFPGLGFILKPPIDIFAGAGVRPEAPRKEVCNPERVKELFDSSQAAMKLVPELNVGDVVAFTNWSLHFSDVQEAHTGTRHSLELRYECHSMWHQFFDQPARLSEKA